MMTFTDLLNLNNTPPRPQNQQQPQNQSPAQPTFFTGAARPINTPSPSRSNNENEYDDQEQIRNYYMRYPGQINADRQRQLEYQQGTQVQRPAAQNGLKQPKPKKAGKNTRVIQKQKKAAAVLDLLKRQNIERTKKRAALAATLKRNRAKQQQAPSTAIRVQDPPYEATFGDQNGDGEQYWMDQEEEEPIKNYRQVVPYEVDPVQSNQLYLRNTIGKRPSMMLKQGYLHAFPQWAAAQEKKYQKRDQKDKLMLQSFQDIKNPQSIYFKGLNDLNANLAHWNQQMQQWQGKQPDYAQKRLNVMKKLSNKIQKNSGVLDTKIDSVTASQQVPPMIKSLVNANTALSQVGFGPIKEGGISLYAGRWLDTRSGNVRVLPQANLKYINPASRQQKLGYLQAKMINHWNQLVSMYEEYLKVNKKTDKSYASGVARSIQNGLDLSGLLIKYSNALNRRIINYLMYPSANSMVGYIMEEIPLQALQQVYNLAPQDIEDNQQNRSNKKLVETLTEKSMVWEVSVQNACERMNEKIMQDGGLTDLEKARLQIQLNRANLNMLAGPGRSVAQTLKKVQKIAIIPDKLTQNQLMTVSKVVDQASNMDQQAVQRIMGRGYSAKQITTIADYGKQLAKSITNGKMSAFATAVTGAKAQILNTTKSPVQRFAPTLERYKTPTMPELRRRVFS